MTEQTLQHSPNPQQASAPYAYEERIGGTWPQALTTTALFTALFAAYIFKVNLLTFILVFCCVAFGIYTGRQRAAARRTLPTSYSYAPQLVFVIALLALAFPVQDDPASAVWRLPLVAITTLIFHRFVAPGYHRIGKGQEN